MRSHLQICSKVLRSALALLAVATLAATSQAAVQNRITSAVRENSRVSLAHTVIPKAQKAQDLGLAPSSLKLENMSIRFSLTDAQHAALDQLLRDQQNPSSPQYRQWLTPQQFGAQFGLSANDLATVTAWLTAQGFTITNTANSGTFINFSGTVGQAQQAFGTTIHNLSYNGEQHIANLTEPTLPSAIASVVTNISGLDDFKLKSRARKMDHRTTTSANPNLSINVCTNQACTTTTIEHFITPGDFATIYDTQPLLTASNNGTGIKIAIMGQVDIVPSDIAAFRTASGLSANVPSVVVYGADPGAAQTNCPTNSNTFCPTTDDLDESELDIEWAGAAAPSASIIFVNSTNVISTSLVQAIDNKVAPILSVSYGGCEVTDFPVTVMNSLNTTFQQANAQGQTIFAPTGDTGATDCDSGGVTTASKGLAVDFPSSSPYVTAVGGSEFNEGTDTATPNGTYWNNAGASNTVPTASTALSYIPETVWNDTASEIATSPTTASLSGGGGGVSVVFAKPSWQIGTGVPNDAHRDTPDVSLSASADHDAYMVCAQGSCQNGTYFTSGTGSFNAFGGTSVSTPSFAGIMALVEQKLGGISLGNVNPYIYALANGNSYSTIFHDITTGSNKQPCTVGSTGCTSSPIGYSAGVGYDQATGWGSVDANQFVTKFSSATTELTTTTALTSSSPSAVTGTSITFTAKITPSSTGAAAPTGTVSFFVGNSTTAVATPTISAAGTATYTTSFNSGGTQTITAVYSGDGNYFGSTGSVVETITTPVGSAPTTTTLSSSATSVASGSAITLTATVASTVSGTLGGTVVFSNGSTTLGTATVVPGTAGNTGTATLPVTATTANFPIGANSIIAVFQGGGTATNPAGPFAGSTSNTLAITVTNPTITLTVAPTALSFSNGSSGTATVTINAAGGFSGNIMLTASTTSTTFGNLASVAFCSNNPVPVTAGTAATCTVTIATPNANTNLKGGTIQRAGGSSQLWTEGGLTFAGLLMFFGLGKSRRKRWPTALFGLLAATILASAMGCGSSSTVTASGIPNGTYPVTISGAASSNSAVTGSVTLNVTLN